MTLLCSQHMWVPRFSWRVDEAKRARAAIESVPEAVESTITRLEKKSKEMEKNSTSQATKHKMIKDLFGRL